MITLSELSSVLSDLYVYKYATSRHSNLTLFREGPPLVGETENEP